MSTPKEFDFAYMGLRIKTMDIVPDGGAMILDSNGELCAMYTPHAGWRGSRSVRDFHTLVLAHDTAQMIADAAHLAKAPSE